MQADGIFRLCKMQIARCIPIKRFRLLPCPSREGGLRRRQVAILVPTGRLLTPEDGVFMAEGRLAKAEGGDGQAGGRMASS